ncbi:MAG: metal-dependent hydrolase, partial [Acidobacteria bacterium]|nr:metal-dependent hydrolase [Acidobacteriota bacterium]
MTHTLVGANLASTRLGTKTRFAAAACLIGANAPDIDVTAYFAGEDFAIGFRRGWTHGVLALVVLPIVLWAALLLWDRLVRRLAARRQGEQTERTPALHSGWLFAICLLSIVTHPFLDWLNVYGMRWLMPFDSTWFYGDSVFIMDPWLWLILAGFWLLPRRPSGRLLAVWGLFSALLAAAVAGRAPEYLPLIAIVATVLLLALSGTGTPSYQGRGLSATGLIRATLAAAELLDDATVVAVP